jgi:hypothetical protein
MECMPMDQRFRRGFSAAEKTELWDRWQRGDSSGFAASLAFGIDGLRARGDIERHCSASIGTINSEVAGPLGLDSEPRT